MQRDKISDVKVKLDIASVIKSATFGLPLIAVATNTAIPYTECTSLADVLKVMTNGEKTNGLGTYSDLPAEVERNEDFTLVSVTSDYKITNNIIIGAEVTAASVECDGKTYSQKIEGLEKNSGNIFVKVPATAVCRVVFGCASGETSTLRISNDNVTNIVKTANATDKVTSVTFKGDTNDSFYLSSSDSEIYIYAIEYYTYNALLYDTAEKMLLQKDAPETFAVANVTTTNIETLLAYDWRQAVLIGANSAADVAKDFATQVQLSDEKLLYVAVDSLDTDVSFYKDYSRTILNYYVSEDMNNNNLLASALVGATSSKVVGSFDYKAQKLSFLNELSVPKDLAYNDYKKAINKNIMMFVRKAGMGVTDSGNCADGTPIDLIDTQDWIILQIEYQIQQLLNNSDKIPYDNSGIAMLEAVVVNVLQDAFTNGMIAVNDEGGASFTVDFKQRNETRAEDREARRYVEANFSFDLAGSIRTVVVNGIINI